MIIERLNSILFCVDRTFYTEINNLILEPRAIIQIGTVLFL